MSIIFVGKYCSQHVDQQNQQYKVMIFIGTGNVLVTERPNEATLIEWSLLPMMCSLSSDPVVLLRVQWFCGRAPP